LAVLLALLLALPATAQAPGTVLRDCVECPEMVVVPAGYTRLASGGTVRIETPFLVGKFEVTFEEYDACVRAGACACCPDDNGWGRRRQPVIDVSWHDAQDYADWLSKRAGKTYRLLSEAEWEYAAQAGTGREAFARAGADEANCNGCGSLWHGPAPVGSFSPNGFGLHDMLGNVWEWTDTCRENPFSQMMQDIRGCVMQSLRGGAYTDRPSLVRSIKGDKATTNGRGVNVGFRVARTL
jgi:formylglycine-generating enzyme required for sulfatase activity